MSIGTKIKMLRTDKDLTMDELIQIMQHKYNGDSPSNKATLSKWENDKVVPETRFLLSYSNYFNVSLDWLTGKSEYRNKEEMFEEWNKKYADKISIELSEIDGISIPASKAIPIVGEIAAGTPITANQNLEGYFFIDNSIKADFCLTVTGDSMIDAGIENGDIAFLKQTNFVDSGKIAAVIIDEEATLKKVFWNSPEEVILQPCNAKYSPIVLSDALIVGELIGVFHRV